MDGGDKTHTSQRTPQSLANRDIPGEASSGSLLPSKNALPASSLSLGLSKGFSFQNHHIKGFLVKIKDSAPETRKRKEKKRKEKEKKMEMQLLYSKLHDKYTELKMRKESEIEQYNREQKSKFMNYVSAAEEMIEHLKTANESLQAKINELTDKIIPDRSVEEYQYAEYQKLLIEERQKTKELSEEVERLRNLLQEKSDYIDKSDNSIDGQLKSPYGGSQLRSRDLSEGSAGLKTLRPCSGVQTEEVMVIPNAGSQEVHVMVKEPERGPGQGMPYNEALGNSQQPCSCRRTMASSGDGLNDVCHGDCHFQTLVERLVGMKFSTVNQTEGLCVSVLHQSSDTMQFEPRLSRRKLHSNLAGYSFSLKWVKNVVGEEPELLYHVVSLGTFERLAPEWMREDLIFSMSMCAIFFERVLQVTRLHC